MALRSSTFSYTPRSRKYFNLCSRTGRTSCHDNPLPMTSSVHKTHWSSSPTSGSACFSRLRLAKPLLFDLHNFSSSWPFLSSNFSNFSNFDSVHNDALHNVDLCQLFQILQLLLHPSWTCPLCHSGFVVTTLIPSTSIFFSSVWSLMNFNSSFNAAHCRFLVIHLSRLSQPTEVSHFTKVSGNCKVTVILQVPSVCFSLGDSPTEKVDCLAHFSKWPVIDNSMMLPNSTRSLNTRDPHCIVTAPVHSLLCGNCYWSWLLGNSSSGVRFQRGGQCCTVVSATFQRNSNSCSWPCVCCPLLHTLLPTAAGCGRRWLHEWSFLGIRIGFNRILSQIVWRWGCFFWCRCGCCNSAASLLPLLTSLYLVSRCLTLVSIQYFCSLLFFWEEGGGVETKASWLHAQAAAAHKNASSVLCSGCNTCSSGVWRKIVSLHKQGATRTAMNSRRIENALQATRVPLLTMAAHPWRETTGTLRMWACLALKRKFSRRRQK